MLSFRQIAFTVLLISAVVAILFALTSCAGLGPQPKPRRITATVIWENERCLRAPGHEERCSDGYVIARCNNHECDCEMHVYWSGYIEETAAMHEMAHCIDSAAGTADSYHEGSKWSRL